MNWDEVQGNWKEFKGGIKVRWGKLTDDDLDVIAGQREQLIGSIQKHYGMKKEQVEDQLEEFFKNRKEAKEKEAEALATHGK